MKPEISVVIATWNRAGELKRCLESLQCATLDPRKFEVVIADNNSTDDTRNTVADFAAGSAFPVKYVFESRQGKSCALNAGLRAASGEIIACTDDDCVLDARWLEALVDTFKDPAVGVVGGPAKAVFPDSVLQNPGLLFLGKRFLGDFAPYDKLIEVFHDNPPLGLNMAFRAEVAKAIDGYDETIGITGERRWGREETDFVRRAQKAGYRVFYQPAALVNHMLTDQRVNWKAISRTAYECGIGTYWYRYAPAVKGSVPKRIGYTLVFGLELLYACLRICLFSAYYPKRTVACFRARATLGKLAGMWSSRQDWGNDGLL